MISLVFMIETVVAGNDRSSVPNWIMLSIHFNEFRCRKVCTERLRDLIMFEVALVEVISRLISTVRLMVDHIKSIVVLINWIERIP